MSEDTEGTVYGQQFAMVPEWILDSDISDRAFRLFACLARYANAKGRAFPGRKRIADRLKCSVDTVDRAMAELVEIEAIKVEKQFRKDGSRTSNNYWMWPICPPPQICGPPAADSRPGSRDDAAPKNESQKNESQRNENPSATDVAGEVVPLFETSEPPPPRTAKDELIERQFAEFWQAYPRKRDRTPAFKAFRKAISRGVDSRVMIEGAKRYADEMRATGTQQQHVKYGERFINAEAWTNQAEETTKERLVRLAKERGQQARGASA